MMPNVNIFLVFGAGLTSILSPCVLPVVPIVVAGTGKERRTRPVLVVAGLATTFMAMGILSTLFGAVIGPAMQTVEKIAAILIVSFGVLMLLNVNLFKHLGFLTRLRQPTGGTISGYLLGATLGVIWIPCVGPMLSAVLAMVAADGTLGHGVGYLLVYSLGFSVPLLTAGYAAQGFRNRVGFVRNHPLVYRIVSGVILIALGVFIFFEGMMAFGA